MLLLSFSVLLDSVDKPLLKPSTTSTPESYAISGPSFNTCWVGFTILSLITPDTEVPASITPLL